MKKERYQVAEKPNKEVSKVSKRIPDGTKITLNPNSMFFPRQGIHTRTGERMIGTVTRYDETDFYPYRVEFPDDSVYYYGPEDIIIIDGSNEDYLLFLKEGVV